jgi:hypothetical protein
MKKDRTKKPEKIVYTKSLTLPRGKRFSAVGQNGWPSFSRLSLVGRLVFFFGKSANSAQAASTFFFLGGIRPFALPLREESGVGHTETVR